MNASFCFVNFGLLITNYIFNKQELVQSDSQQTEDKISESDFILG